jgi:hypothetical protein
MRWSWDCSAISSCRSGAGCAKPFSSRTFRTPVRPVLCSGPGRAQEDTQVLPYADTDRITVGAVLGDGPGRGWAQAASGPVGKPVTGGLYFPGTAGAELELLAEAASE